VVTVPELNMLYVHSKSLGYGRMGVGWAEQLEALGVDVYDELPSPVPADAIRRANERHGEKPRKAKVCRTALWASVPTHARGWWRGQRPVIATMWEATRLPEQFRETLHEFDLCVVPSEQNVELFSKYHPNVVKVPLGIDSDVWRPVERTAPGMFFNFLAGGSGARKGIDVAFKAFHAAFPEGSWGDGPIPRLVLKNPKGEDYNGPRIDMVAGRITDEEEVALYASAHCYVQPSRGEGFGLQPLQAIAQGCPTILTDAHGHGEFAHLGRPVGWSYSKADYFIYGDAGEWWEPNFDEVVDQMRWVYDHYDEACGEAWANAQVAHEEFSWRRSASRLVMALGESLFEDAPVITDYLDLSEWYSPDVRRYRVMVNRPWAADIAGVSYQFEPEQVYWELADVKRILFEGNILDPACLTDDDHGLAEGQVAKMGDYSAAHAYCGLCHQRLGSQPTKSDDLMGMAR
jgi:glycosyltransferase involved in cell wall biosynthesis